MNKLIIDRQKWLRGNNDSYLLAPTDHCEAGKMCCLGHLGKLYGLTDDEMYERKMPYECAIGSHKFPLALEKRSDIYCDYEGKRYNLRDTMHQDIFAIINDNSNIDEETREAWIKEGFKQLLDIDVEFIN